VKRWLAAPLVRFEDDPERLNDDDPEERPVEPLDERAVGPLEERLFEKDWRPAEE